MYSIRIICAKLYEFYNTLYAVISMKLKYIFRIKKAVKEFPTASQFCAIFYQSNNSLNLFSKEGPLKSLAIILPSGSSR